MKKSLSIFVIVYSFLLTGCTREKDTVVTIRTKYGDMVAILYDETPKHKANFIKLAKEHFFDSLLFHRVIPGFMIQGGDPESKHAPGNVSLGNGDPGYSIDAEINPNYFHEKGALAAARLSDQQNPTKASNGSQFYIVQGNVMSEMSLKLDQEKFTAAFQQLMQNPVHKPMFDSLTMIYQQGDVTAYERYFNSLVPRVEKITGSKVTRDIDPLKVKAYTSVGGTPGLDGEYTVFGKVIRGLEVIDSIAKQPTQLDRPINDIRMEITVDEIPRKKITELYGFTYPEKTKN